MRLDLLCPLCNCKYSANSKVADNRRPFLLPCGHNMCEECILDNHKEINFKCIICFKSAFPPSMNRSLRGTEVTNILEYYELDFAVVEDITSVDCKGCCVDDQDMSDSSLSENISFGELDDWSNEFDLDADSACSKETDGLINESKLCIGDDIFKMPMKLKCMLHKNVSAKTFCLTCQHATCENCIIPFHAGHLTSKVGDMNAGFIDEIPASLSSINSAILHLSNAQQVLQNTKKKLDDFAGLALAGISSHFRLLHEQLQSLEQHMVTMVHEANLSPQQQLDRAVARLQAFEEALKRLREPLSGENDVGFKVPKDILLSDVIVMLNDLLEKTPSIVNVTKIGKNPFTLKFDEDLVHLFLRTIKCQFLEPKIIIRLNNEYGHQIVMSNAMSTGSSSSFGFDSFNRKTLELKAGTASSFGSDSFSCKAGSAPSTNPFRPNFSGSMEQDNIVHSLSALIIDAEKPLCPVLSGDWLRQGEVVIVSSVKSPSEFYVSSIESGQRIGTALNEFGPRAACLPPDAVVVGQHYIVLVNQSEVSRWHRGLVTQKAAGGEGFKVLLLDLGVDLQVPREDFRKLPRHLALKPYAAARCCLKGIVPINGNSEWHEETTAFFKQMLQNSPTRITYLGPLKSGRYEVDLAITLRKSTPSICEALVWTHRAKQTTPPGRLQFSAVAPATERFPKLELRVGDVHPVQVLHVDDPYKFYVMISEYKNKRLALQTHLQGIMETQSAKPIYAAHIHQACAFQAESGQWFRARIEKLLPKGYVEICLVDIGINRKVIWANLFVLPFQQPLDLWQMELSIKCCLADVKPLLATGKLWTSTAIEAFRHLTANTKLRMEVISNEDQGLHVMLSFTQIGDRPKNVAALLVAENLCQSTGENSRIINVMNPKHEDTDLSLIKVEILHVVHPGEFYVVFPDFVQDIKILRKTVQAAAAELESVYKPKLFWKPGELCLVFVTAYADQKPLWHRGQVIGPTVSDSVTYQVRLQDLGEVARVHTDDMIPLKSVIRHIPVRAKCCRLFGLLPSDGKWSPQAKAFCKQKLMDYEALRVTVHECSQNCMNVTLWGEYTKLNGPFQAETVKYRNINKRILQATFAKETSEVEHEAERETAAISRNSSSSCSNSDNDGSLCSVEDLDDVDLPPTSLSVANQTEAAPLALPNIEHNYQMPPLELLQDLNATTRTVGCSKPPMAWMQPRPLKKSLFSAVPTYVNDQCEVYLNLDSDEPFMNGMRSLLQNKFKPMVGQQLESGYIVGQPVVVEYHLDKMLYRGIVQSQLSVEGEHEVYFVDYGNVEWVAPAKLLPYAPFPQLRAMCIRVAIYGVQPKGGSYSKQATNVVHKTLVMKLCSVRVVQAMSSNRLAQCQIKFDDMDIATIMINKDMAVRAKPPEFQLGKLDQPDPSQIGDQPPPAKKKHLMTMRNLEMMKLPRPFEFDKENVQIMEIETDQKTGTDEENLEQNVDNELSPDIEEASFMPPQGILAIDEVRQRLQLRCEERLPNAHFAPIDTSTERSYYDGGDLFKKQNLPTGVKEFLCIIIKVLSATELQVYPLLTEFAKQEIVQAQEINNLIQTAAQLHPVQVHAICLARHSRYSQWFRAVVKELHPATNEATVYYIDFYDTQTVSFTDLKCMPDELFMFPQRSFRVRLHGIKWNPRYPEMAVLSALRNCLYKVPTAFAVVPQAIEYQSSDNDEDTDSGSSNESTEEDNKLLEVEIFNDKNKNELVYHSLIISKMYLNK